MLSINAYIVGDAVITRITEQLITTLSPQQLFPDSDQGSFARYRDWMTPDHLSENLQTVVMSVHSWLVRTPHHLILVDTASGNGKNRPFSVLFHQLHSPWLERLAAAGVAPEDIDLVLLTHLHVDHVGWNTVLKDGRWKPTFPNARYVFSKAEMDFYSTPEASPRMMVFEDSVQPVIEAGQADVMADGGGEYQPGIYFHPTPGHSVGHMSISLDSQGEVALFCGDVMHHPIQVYHPQWNSVFCAEQDLSRSSRRWVLDHALQTRARVFTTHFAGSSVGTIAITPDGYAWQPL